MIKMIGLDLDGTLLTKEKKVTDKTRIALEEAALRGIHIVPVTGRPLSGIPPKAMAFPFIRYAITSNGAIVTDIKTGRTIRKHCMSSKTAEQVLRATEEDSIIQEYFTEGKGFHGAETRALLWEKFEGTPILSYLERSRHKVDDFYMSLREKKDGIENLSVMFASRTDRDRAIARIRTIKGIRIILPKPTDIEITSADADKGEALIALAKELDIRREEVMAIGDGDNDFGLMKAAGFSVAMGNADQWIKDEADFVTLDNEHDGVEAAIRRFAL